MTSKIEQGLAFHDAGDLDRAEHCYLAAVEDDPTNGDALKLLALVAAERGQAEDALAYIDAAIAARPDVIQYRQLLARLHVRAGRTLQAVYVLREAAAKSKPGPERLQILADLGLCLEEASNWDEAEGVYAEILEADPHHRVALHGKGGCAAALGQLELAEKTYEQLLVLDPGDSGASQALEQVRTWIRDPNRP